MNISLLLRRNVTRIHYSTIRSYAKKSAKNDTSTLIPMSKRVIQDDAGMDIYNSASSKMSAAIEWFRKEASKVESRASGRVTPALLSSVKVTLASGQHVGLEDISTVGVREGSSLLITLFEETNTKAVEQALYSAKLPGIIPQRVDTRTIKIPIPKPTLDTKNALITAAQRQAEESRVQIRNHFTSHVKKGKWAKDTQEYKEFRKLTDQSISEIDKIVDKVKKS